jgi:hypothetical protein
VTKPSGTKYQEIKMKPIDNCRDSGVALQGGALKALAAHIAAHLRGRPFCVVFEDDLERCWPSERLERAEREKEIQFFAKSHGWTAVILTADPGIRALFQKLEQGAANYEGSSVIPA